MMGAGNQPIAYDDHGDIPFHVPFREIPRSAISIYLQLDTRVGKPTCGQTCAHCFYINQPEARHRSMSLGDGKRLMDDLRRKGFQVFPMIADSLADGGAFLEVFADSHNRDLRQELARSPTKTMRRGEMWTSGRALLGPDWRTLLARGVQNGFGSVTITFHGLLDEHLELRPHEAYPIRGVFSGADCVTAIERIHELGGLEVNVGITIGTHNSDHESLLRYVRFFNRLGVAVLRFNCFHDHGGHHPDLVLTKAEVARVFRSLKAIHDNEPVCFQLGIDEDFGTSGIEVMGFPAHTGWCRAGRQLFAFVPGTPRVLDENDDGVSEHIGPLAGCVDAFEPIMGHVVRYTDKRTGASGHDIVFYDAVIDELLRKRLNGTYRDGCFASEMLAARQAPIALRTR